MLKSGEITKSTAPSIVQEGNKASGNIIGRDYINTNNFYTQPATPSSLLLRLLEKLRAEIQLDSQTTCLINELQRYQEPKSKTTKTLATKLEEGNRKDLIEFATDAKETFTKKLTKFSLFESAQEIHALILARIHNIFNTQIRPLILVGADRIYIENSIQISIIDPIVLDLSTDPLRYYNTEAYGMLYFLTGNCHIDWI